MARLKQTARKSTGGKAPRRLLASYARNSRPKKNKKKVSAPTIAEKEIPKNDVQLGFCFSPEQAEACNKISTAPIFDLGNSELVKKYLQGFTVQRKTSWHQVTEKDKELLDSVFVGAQEKFPGASYLVLRQYQDVVDVQSDEDFPEIESIIESGKLHGCDLRGNREFGQFGLVSNTHLKEGTPIAVECGRIWSMNLHEEWLEKEEDPLRGLSANYIPAAMLRQFMNPRWKRHLTSQKDDFGFVVECSSHGNETKHIEDASWIHAGHGSPVIEPNLESHLVLNIKDRSLSVVFETNTDVPPNTELMMDYGCWREISSVLLPGQVMMSIKAKKDLDDVVAEAANKEKAPARMSLEERKRRARAYALGTSTTRTKNKRTPTRDKSTENQVQHDIEKPVYFSRIGDLDIDESLCIHDERYKILASLSENWTNPGRFARRPPKKLRALLYEEVPDVDYSSPIANLAQFPEGKREHWLSKKARRAIANIIDTDQPHMQDDPVLSKGYNLAEHVKVVSIKDVNNPTYLFSLPDREPRGLLAKHAFKKGETVLCYGGLIMDRSKTDDFLSPFDSYIFDLDLSFLNYNGPELVVWGKDSVGGMMNDAISIGGGFRRKANLSATADFDSSTGTPQIVFYALTNIDKGEELLYDYGIQYWKIAWKDMMMSHATYAVCTQAKARKIRDKS